MGDTRLKILALARRALEEQGGSPEEREYILKLLDILSASIEKYSSEYHESTERLVQGLFDNRAVLAMLRQQTEELDALKKLSIDLTSSLDLPDVLDAVVSEAIRLIANASDVHIFLYKNKKLTYFDTNTSVIVVAATNRPDVLDPALLRPGRFDRQVILDRPDMKGRVEILRVHTKGKPLDKAIAIEEVAKQSPGFSGADLANLVNEAALLASRRGKRVVTNREFEDAKDKVMMGAGAARW